MGSWLTGAAALALGALVAFLNYLISRAALRRAPERYGLVSMLRQLLNVGALVAAYFAAPLTDWERVPLLVATALGVTLPMFLFTALLLREQRRGGEPAGTDGKEGADHGRGV